MKIALAPMEGLVDAPLRALLTRMGGIDWCVTEFVRVTDTLLPERTFLRLAPESACGWTTPACVPVRLQLLGSDPACLADNAVRAVSMGAPVVDLNFGCPAPTVNRHRGGAALLKEPELLHAIVSAVRRAIPVGVPVTAKMRLGFDNTDLALDCAHALADGGAAEIVVHARTKVEGYRPPAHWEWIARIREAVAIPVVANGEVWTLKDWQDIRTVSGCSDVMIGRGLVTRPDLARRIKAVAAGAEDYPLGWPDMLQEIAAFAIDCQRFAPGSNYVAARLKQWLKLLLLPSGWPDEATALFAAVRSETTEAGMIGRIEQARDTARHTA